MLQKEKRGRADMRAHFRTSRTRPRLKMIYAHTRTQISENFSAPICTKIAARVRVLAHARTLKFCYKLFIESKLWIRKCDLFKGQVNLKWYCYR